MTEPISDQQLDLDQIQARANAATDGPWDVKAHTHGASGCRCLSCDDPAVGFTVDHTKALDCDERVAARSADGELNDFRRPLGSCSEGPLLTFADASFAARAREDVPALAAEVRRLRDRVAELEAYAYGCDAEGCVLPHSSWCDAAKKTAAANQGCTCGRPWTGHPQPHAMHCWTVNPPRAEVEEMRKRIAELSAVAASVPPGASVRPSQPSGVSESAQSPTGAPTGHLEDLPSTEDLASADNPTHLRWGLNGVLWSDDGSVIVLLSDVEAGKPFWLELDPERAAVLREDLAGPDGAPSPERDALIAELLPAWEAMYEPGNVSDYLIGYANSEAAAKGAAEAWMRSQAEVTGRLEWEAWVDPASLPDGYDALFELIQRHDDGIDTGPGIAVRHRATTDPAR